MFFLFCDLSASPSHTIYIHVLHLIFLSFTSIFLHCDVFVTHFFGNGYHISIDDIYLFLLYKYVHI